MQTTYWFGGWDAIIRIVLISAGGYIALIVLLRLGGWRRLTRMSVFDFIVTVTIGSAFGRILTAREVGIIDAIVTFTMLILLQQTAAWVQRRSPAFARLVRPKPALLYYRGAVLDDAMARARLRRAELLQAVRSEGFGSLTEVEAVVLEPDGGFSIIGASTAGDRSAIDGLSEAESRTEPSRPG